MQFSFRMEMPALFLGKHNETDDLFLVSRFKKQKIYE